jgi:hypothetical protein
VDGWSASSVSHAHMTVTDGESHGSFHVGSGAADPCPVERSDDGSMGETMGGMGQVIRPSGVGDTGPPGQWYAIRRCPSRCVFHPPCGIAWGHGWWGMLGRHGSGQIGVTIDGHGWRTLPDRAGGWCGTDRGALGAPLVDQMGNACCTIRFGIGCSSRAVSRNDSSATPDVTGLGGRVQGIHARNRQTVRSVSVAAERGSGIGHACGDGRRYRPHAGQSPAAAIPRCRETHASQEVMRIAGSAVVRAHASA